MRSINELAELVAVNEVAISEITTYRVDDGECFEEEQAAADYAFAVSVLHALELNRIIRDEAEKLFAARYRGDF